jgi:hypothetical protein
VTRTRTFLRHVGPRGRGHLLPYVQDATNPEVTVGYYHRNPRTLLLISLLLRSDFLAPYKARPNHHGVLVGSAIEQAEGRERPLRARSEPGRQQDHGEALGYSRVIYEV